MSVPILSNKHSLLHKHLYFGYSVSVTYRATRAQPWIRLFFNCWLYFCITGRGAGVAQWREHSPHTNVAPVRFRPITTCGLSLLLVLVLVPRFFSCFSGFLPYSKTSSSCLSQKLSVHGRGRVAATCPWNSSPLHFLRVYTLWFWCCYMSPLHVPATRPLSVNNT